MTDGISPFGRPSRRTILRERPRRVGQGSWRGRKNADTDSDTLSRESDVASTKANTYEKQAMYSIVCAGVAVAAALAAIALIIRNLDFEAWTLYMPRNGNSFPLMLAGVGAACLLGTVGFFIGFSSAGHSRNKRSKLSWMGFFGSAAAISLGLSAFIFYYFTRLDF